MSVQSTPVLILGGGVAGLGAAVEFTRLGVASLVAEKGPALGGRAAGFCCKALAACARCGACRVGDLLTEAAAGPGVSALTLAAPTAARPLAGGGWEVDLAPQPGEAVGPNPLSSPLMAPLTVAARAVVLAVGYSPFDPRQKTRFGYGRVPGVVTALELEAMLKEGGLPAPLKRVAFIQCVGSRDQALGRLYCSRVCCGYALRLAGTLMAARGEAAVTFFHMDVQGYGRAWEQELKRMRGQMRFVRAMPGEVVKGPEGPEVVYAGPNGAPAAEGFDLVVLSIGLGAPAGADELAAMFGLGRTADGFLAPGLDSPGVAVAGAASGPLSINESIVHAAQAAAQAHAWAAGPARGEAAHA